MQTLHGEDKMAVLKKTNKTLMQISDAINDATKMLATHGHLQWLLELQQHRKEQNNNRTSEPIAIMPARMTVHQPRLISSSH